MMELSMNESQMTDTLLAIEVCRIMRILRESEDGLLFWDCGPFIDEYTLDDPEFCEKMEEWLWDKTVEDGLRWSKERPQPCHFTIERRVDWRGTDQEWVVDNGTTTFGGSGSTKGIALANSIMRFGNE